MADDLVQRVHGAMDITVELGIAANVHDDMTGKPNAIANSIRRGIAEIERLRAEIAELRARAERAERRIADAETAVIAKMPGSAFGVFVLAPEWVGKRVALVVVND